MLMKPDSSSYTDYLTQRFNHPKGDEVLAYLETSFEWQGVEGGAVFCISKDVMNGKIYIWLLETDHEYLNDPDGEEFRLDSWDGDGEALERMIGEHYDKESRRHTIEREHDRYTAMMESTIFDFGW